jgi:hypothetical protein
MSSDDHHHHHHHKTHKVLDKITSKISSIKDDITEVVKERTHSRTSDNRNSISSDHSLSNVDHANFTSHDGIPSVSIETHPTFRGYGM